MVTLSPKWAEFFRNQPETGMGYWVCSVILKDGSVVERVVVVGGVIVSVNDDPTIHFTEDDISKFVVTQDKSARRHSSK